MHDIGEKFKLSNELKCRGISAIHSTYMYIDRLEYSLTSVGFAQARHN